MHFYIVCDPDDLTTCRRFDDWKQARSYVRERAASTGRGWVMLRTVSNVHEQPRPADLARELDALADRIDELLAPEPVEA